ncbi:MAG: GNAT family N-acetyltransferase [Clostridia bacterium]|nr:GNAT family N-acetyltransferase [Clostridia bacterium]
MTIGDYPEVSKLWNTIHGFAIRSVDDSYEGVERFLRRNPSTSVVARVNGETVGAVLCGHDGRTGCFYHVCVREDFRRRGIGKAMVLFCVRALREEKISKISLIAFTNNDAGNAFWKEIGWKKRNDLNTYDYVLNEENIVRFNT